VLGAPDGARIYVTTGRGGTLEAVDPVKGLSVASVKVGERPWGLALSADGKVAFTANGPSNDVSFVDLASMAVVARVPVGERPWGVTTVP
jgi:YVTN family beta-propeller protein